MLRHEGRTQLGMVEDRLMLRQVTFILGTATPTLASRCEGQRDKPATLESWETGCVSVSESF